jgi:hypothetical protein
MRKTGLVLIMLLVTGGSLFAGELLHSLSDQDLAKISLDPKFADSTAADNQLSTEQTPITIYSDQQNSPLTLRAFPKILGHNFVGLFSKQNLLPFLIGMGATGASHGLDEDVGEYFGPRNSHTFLSNTGNEFGKPFVLAPAIGTLFVAGLNAKDNRFKSFTYSLMQGYVIDWTVSAGLLASQLSRKCLPSRWRSHESGGGVFTILCYVSIRGNR